MEAEEGDVRSQYQTPHNLLRSERTSSKDNDASTSATKAFLPGFKDVNGYAKAALQRIMLATRAANDLPSVGDDFDYYSSFSSFRRLMTIEADRIIQTVQDVMRYHGVKGNLAGGHEDVIETEDKFDVLVDANDQLLERVGTLLDEAAGLKKEVPLVMATVTPKQAPVASWNRKVTPKSSGSGLTYRLLAARNIQRPQLEFKDKIDNSSRAFVPTLPFKYNALKPLSESLICDIVEGQVTEDDSLTYPHPYQFELDRFTPPDDMLTEVVPQPPADITASELQFIDSVPDLEKLVKTLKAEKEIAVDLEHHSYRTFLGLTCLMQISTRSSDFVVDTLRLRGELHRLNDVFTDPRIVKVLHGADMDVQWLQRDCGLYLVSLFDSGQAARVLGLARFSLAFLLHTYCAVDADKQFQLADWRIRPLPAELLKYAREDTHYLLYIYDRLRNELLQRGNEHQNLLLSVLQRSKALCAKRYSKPTLRDDSHLELYRRSRKHFNSQQLAALKAIYEWRHLVARNEDESTGYVLPNHMLLQMASLLPKEPPGILACCNPVPPLVKQNLSELHAIVKGARDTTLIKPSPLRKLLRPTTQQHPKYNITNLLHCPHDLSHPHPTDSGLARDKSSPRKGGDILALDTAILSAIVTDGMKGKLSDSQWKAVAIKAMFSSPFAKYLPAKPAAAAETDEATLTMTRLEKDLTVENQWKLLPNTTQTAQVAAPVSTAQKVVDGAKSEVEYLLIDDDGEEEAASVRQQCAAARKRKSEDGGQGAPRAVKFRPRPKRVADATAAAAESGETVDEEFEAHDYNKADLSVFQGGGSGGKKKKKSRPEYDPDKHITEPKFKRGSKSRLKPSSGKKSMTSRSGSRPVQRIAWPRQ